MASAKMGKSARSADVFELKSATLSLLALVLKSADLDAIEAELDQRLGETPDLFAFEPLLIDLSQLPRVAPVAEGEQAPLGLDEDGVAAIDLTALVSLLRRHRIQAAAVLGANAAERNAARELGLAEAPADALTPTQRKSRSAPVVQEVIREVIKEVVVEVPVPAESRTLIIDKPLRSGQQVYAKGGDLVVLALVNHGAEVIADGSIHVYAPLRGKAIAGALGNTEARIFAASMEAELISIAGTYRTTENPLPDTVLGKPAQIRLDGDKLVMEPLKF
ncbi:MAG TPA: septum site-determining protein MinC [Burkholderiaceae bacterium]|jgi:septum site-determining protein MinC